MDHATLEATDVNIVGDAEQAVVATTTTTVTKVRKQRSNKDKMKEGDNKSEKLDKPESSNSDAVPIPLEADVQTFPARAYTWSQLKFICRHFRIKVTGNKSALTAYIQEHLRKQVATRKIQRWWRCQVWRRFYLLRGPARFKRTLCVNDDDFFTMDPVTDIPLKQFISYQDVVTDGKVYGFDVMSLFNLVTKSTSYTDQLLNPFNRALLPKELVQNLSTLMHYSNLLSKDVKVQYRLLSTPSSPTISYETRVTTLFNDMDSLGNYTDARWFTDLTRAGLIKFVMDLKNIWNYRANLPEQVKRDICPNGSLLHDLHQYLHWEEDFAQLRLNVLRIIENFVRSGIDRDSRCLGTNFVLCALTLNSGGAAEALPWLYHSVN